MTERYTHLREEYARKTAEILNGLCSVNLVHGNKMKTITKQSKTHMLQVPETIGGR